MNNRKLILIALLISTISFAQINITGALKENALNSRSPFLDAASNNPNADNYGKGLLFPRTDLTSFTTMSPTSNGASFQPTSNPNGFDGMIVFNVGTGTSGIGGVQVTPGYYYYRNTTAGTASPDINGGTWIRISDTASIDPGLFEKDAAGNLVKLTNKSNGTARTGTEQFIIKDDGKVGVGVVSPQEMLDIAGSIKLRDTVAASRAVLTSLRVPNSTPVDDYVLSTDALGNLSWTPGPSTANDPNDHIGNKNLTLSGARILTTADKNLKFKGTGGDVDINDGAVTAVSLATTNLKLGSSNTPGQILVANSTDGTVKFGDAPKKGLFENDNTNTQAKLTNLSDDNTVRPTGTEFVIKDDGKVGVGTADPKQRVDVVGGNIKTTDTVITKLIKITGAPSSGYVLVSDAQGNATWEDIKEENYIHTITINYAGVSGGVRVDNLKILAADGNLYPDQSEWTIIKTTNVPKNVIGVTLDKPTQMGGPAQTYQIVVEHKAGVPTTGFSGIQLELSEKSSVFQLNTIIISYTGSAPDDLVIYNRRYKSPAFAVPVDMKATDPVTEDNLVKFIDGTNTADAVYTKGNVGVGLPNPSKTLEVSGSIRTSDTLFTKDLQLLTDNTPVKDQVLTALDDKGNAAWKTMTPQAAGWEPKGNAGTDITTDFIGTTDDKEFNIRTNNLERVKVTTDNRLLLNVQSAWSPFTPGSSNTIGLNTVNNDQRLRLTTGSQDTQNGSQGASIDFFGNNTAINGGRLDLVPGSSAVAGMPAINFYGNDGTSQVQAMTMLGNGNLGIGFVPAVPPNMPAQPHMPTEKLDVLGNIKSSDTLITTGIKITGGTTPPTDGQVLTAVGTTGKGQWKDAVRNIFKDQDLGLITHWSGKLVSGQRSSGSKASANTFLGINSGNEITTGTLNTAVGASTLSKNTTGELNTAIGVNALQNNTTGKQNIAVGVNALINNTTGNNNISLGSELTNSNNNTAVGMQAIEKVVGDDNVALGHQAGLYDDQTGTNNLTAASKSVYIGNNTRGVNSATNQIVIGDQAIGKGSNSVILGNEAIRNTYLRGAVHLDTIALATAPTDGQRLTADGISGKLKWASDDKSELFEKNTSVKYIGLAHDSGFSASFAPGTSDAPLRGFRIDDQGHLSVRVRPGSGPNLQTLNIYSDANITDNDGILMTNSINDSVAYLYEGKGNLGGILDLYGQKTLKTRIAGHDNTNSYINNGGSFGVGTNDPKQTLDVVGDIQATDTIKTQFLKITSGNPGENKILTGIDDKGNAVWKDLLEDENDIKTVKIVFRGHSGGFTFSNLKFIRGDGILYTDQSAWKVIAASKTSQVGITLNNVTNFGSGPTHSTFSVTVEHTTATNTLGFGGFRAQLRHNASSFYPQTITITYTGNRPDDTYNFAGATYANASGLNYNNMLIPDPFVEESITKFVDGIDKNDAVYAGKVGIGTYTPSQKLDVVSGNIQTSNTLITRLFKLTGNTTPKAGQLLTATGSTGEGTWQDLRGIFAFNPTGARVELRSLVDNVTTRPTGTEFVIKDDGKVGIGMTNPSRSLEVAGYARTKDMIETTGLKITGGSPGLGKVLTSDTHGNASWANSLTDDTEIASIYLEYASVSSALHMKDLKILAANGSPYPDQSVWEVTGATGNPGEIGKGLDQTTDFGGPNGSSYNLEVTYRGTGRTLGFGGIQVELFRNNIAINDFYIRPKGGGSSKLIRYRNRYSSSNGAYQTVNLPVSLSQDEVVVGNGISKFVDGTNGGDAVYAYGKVGIGTYDPTAAVDVEGDARVGTILKVGERIGIGTTDPKAPLHVAASQSYANEVYDASFIDRVATGLQEDQGTTSAKLTMDISAYFDNNVISDQKIISASADSFSDERIKDIVSISDPKEDLELLDKIKITNYIKKDTLALGKKMNKKVIAQQVEKVFPQVVSKMRRVIPDIYKSTAQVAYTNGQLTISCPQDLKRGDRVKVTIFVKDKKDSKVITAPVVSADANSFVINTDTIKAEIKSVFVYGREVDDFRTVDYEGLSMLNVSATQEIYKEVKALKEDGKQIKSQIETLEGEAFSDEEMKNLRSMIETFDHSSQMSSKK